MDMLRRVILKPYANGPRFVLRMYDTHRTDWRGQTIIGYTLTERPSGFVIFAGEDFAGSPMHADDSDACVRSLLTFLTLRPGDTDASYFEAYTPDQHAFAAEHAEALTLEALHRFGEG